MKYILYLLAALTAILIGLAAYLYVVTSRPQTAPQTSFTQPFNLTNQNGEIVTQATFLGKPTLYFFGFTHCPDICPTTLGALTSWLNTLGPDAAKLNILFVSIDPERDTPATLKEYITMFHPQISAATGTPGELKAMAKQFMVYYAKVPAKAGENPANYMMSHSSGILMADKNGTFKGMLDAHDPDAEALAKLRELIQ